MSADLIAAFSSRALSDCIYVSMLAASCNNDALKSFVKSIVQEHMTELTRSHPQLPQSMLTDNSLTSAATSTNAGCEIFFLSSTLFVTVSFSVRAKLS